MSRAGARAVHAFFPGRRQADDSLAYGQGPARGPRRRRPAPGHPCRTGWSPFEGLTTFGSAAFEGGAWFYSATFKDDTRSGLATFRGEAGFNWANFQDNAGFMSATFECDAPFEQAVFERTGRLAPLVCAGWVGLSGVVVGGPVTLSFAARGMECRRIRRSSTAELRLRYATVGRLLTGTVHLGLAVRNRVKR